MKYEILVEQTRARIEEIEADSLQEAKEKALDMAERGEIDMDDPETIYETSAEQSRG